MCEKSVEENTNQIYSAITALIRCISVCAYLSIAEIVKSDINFEGRFSYNEHLQVLLVSHLVIASILFNSNFTNK